jgi:hypothetical protein
MYVYILECRLQSKHAKEHSFHASVLAERLRLRALHEMLAMCADVRTAVV